MYNQASSSNSAIWAAEIIAKRAPGFKPRIGIILGSGLGKVAAQIKNPVTISYDDLPNFNVAMTTKIEGHSKKMHLGMLNNVPVVCLEGRAHTYEGSNSLEVIKTIVRTMKLIGCEIMFTTSAVGSLMMDSGPGSLVLIKDHINFMFANALIGPNDERFGDRFTSMDLIYDAALRKSMLDIAKKKNIPLAEGVYLGTSGPTFESHAEIRAFKTLGADVVGMSNIPEVMVARHCGLRVISISSVVNFAAGLSDEIISHEGTLRSAALAVDNLSELITGFVSTIGK